MTTNSLIYFTHTLSFLKIFNAGAIDNSLPIDNRVVFHHCLYIIDLGRSPQERFLMDFWSGCIQWLLKSLTLACATDI